MSVKCTCGCTANPFHGDYEGVSSGITYDGEGTCTGFTAGDLNEFVQHISDVVCQINTTLVAHGHDAINITIDGITEGCFEKGANLSEYLTNLQAYLCACCEAVTNINAEGVPFVTPESWWVITPTIPSNVQEGIQFIQDIILSLQAVDVDVPLYPFARNTVVLTDVSAFGTATIRIGSNNYWVNKRDVVLLQTDIALPDTMATYIYIDSTTMDYAISSVPIKDPMPTVTGDMVCAIRTGVGTVDDTMVLIEYHPVPSEYFNQFVEDNSITAPKIIEATTFDAGIRRIAGVFGVSPVNSIERAIDGKPQLVNDEAAPLSLRYYGTNAVGAKGFHALPTYTFENAENITFADLVILIAAGQLEVGKFYLIIDYRTIYDQPDFDAFGVAKLVVDTKMGDTEPLLVLAVTTSDLAPQVWSYIYPHDYIEYDININTTEVNLAPTKGMITVRIDEDNNRADYDHREILFKRYEDAVTGLYTSYMDNGNNYEEYLTFGVGCRDNYLGDYAKYAIAAGHVFLLSNNVFGMGAINNKFVSLCFNNTFHRIGTYYYDEGIINNDFQYPVINTDFTTAATHVYNEYNCNIYYDATLGIRLSYMNNNLLTTAVITD